jgi:hypothetical protein
MIFFCGGIKMLVLEKIYCNLFWCGNLWKWKLKEKMNRGEALFNAW